MSRASRLLTSTTVSAATATPRTATPTKATTPSSFVSPPSLLSRKTATIGNERLRNWFQRPVSVTARATSRDANPQRRSIAYDVATPAASPPGTTIESAVETCVTVIACANDRPGSTTIHGGAKVSRFTSVAANSSAIHSHERPCTSAQTSR